RREGDHADGRSAGGDPRARAGRHLPGGQVARRFPDRTFSIRLSRSASIRRLSEAYSSSIVCSLAAPSGSCRTFWRSDRYRISRSAILAWATRRISAIAFFCESERADGADSPRSRSCRFSFSRVISYALFG